MESEIEHTYLRERERDGEHERRNEKVKWYKSFVENNRRLGQEAHAFGNEAFGRRTTNDERERTEGWRDKVPDRARGKVEEMSQC